MLQRKAGSLDTRLLDRCKSGTSTSKIFKTDEGTAALLSFLKVRLKMRFREGEHCMPGIACQTRDSDDHNLQRTFVFAIFSNGWGIF